MFDIKIFYASLMDKHNPHYICLWPMRFININKQIFIYPEYRKEDKCVESIENFLQRGQF